MGSARWSAFILILCLTGLSPIVLAQSFCYQIVNSQTIAYKTVPNHCWITNSSYPCTYSCDSNPGHPTTNGVTLSAIATDTGGWYYDSATGTAGVNCNHQTVKETEW